MYYFWHDVLSFSNQSIWIVKTLPIVMNALLLITAVVECMQTVHWNLEYNVSTISDVTMTMTTELPNANLGQLSNSRYVRPSDYWVR